MSQGSRICFEWNKKGTCRFGSSCKFRHVGNGTSAGGASSSTGNGSGGGNASRNVCFEFQRTGRCQRQGCKFQHVVGGGGSSGQTQRSRGGRNNRSALRLSSASDTDRLLKHLSKLDRGKLGDELRKTSGPWKLAWVNHATLDPLLYRIMLEVLSNIPGSSSIDPPSASDFKEVVSRFLSVEAKADCSDDTVLTAVKTVSDAVDRSLQFEWSEAESHVRDSLYDIVTNAQSRLRMRNREHRPTHKKLTDTLENLDKSWIIRLKEHQVTLRDESFFDHPLDFCDWESATVEWLSNPDFFAPSRCPVMKTGQNGVYESPEDYMNTVHRLWVAMTFYDGHASIAPHCKSKGQFGTCGRALWPVADSHGKSENTSRLRCRNRYCSNTVEFSCSVKSHDCLCGDCARAAIEKHLGPPGQGASTHIYDCKLQSINPDGIVCLTEFLSRNPPPSTIHWRTTKRLKAPNLIGVVVLSSSGAALTRTDRIRWGEIVNHPKANYRNEEGLRQQGEVAINLSSVVDGFDVDSIEIGCRVALIDCMCFVPEWIPVLRALEAQKDVHLPFENGKYLNLDMNHPVTDFNSVLDDKTVESVLNTSKELLIEDMVGKSALEPIQEIRRDNALRSTLVRKLTALVDETTLDNMQMISFLDSLRNPVHLTQGPPGTGKSYLGVVLVRALIIIRDLWAKKSRSVAVSPILVLSYKNHAIDEFLVDLTKADKTLSSRSLIRIGGQCKDQRLASFSERSSYNMDLEVVDWRQTIDKLYLLNDCIQATLERKVSYFFSFFHIMTEGPNEKDRRQAAIDATSILMECIVRTNLVSDALEGCSNLGPKDFLRKFEFLEVKQNGSSLDASDRLKAKVKQRNGGKQYLSKLCEESARCGDEHWGDTLLKFLLGKIPLPRCCALDSKGQQCLEIALTPDSPFCDSHRCASLSLSGRCPNPSSAANESIFCIAHVCGADDCSLEKVEKQLFCQFHCCKRCIEVNKEKQAGMANDEPPRNVCDDHPMCLMPSCLKYCGDGSNYCVEHRILKCMALTKKGKPCKGKPISRLRPFCRDHLSHAGSLFIEEVVHQVAEASSAPVAQQQCTMIKKDKTRCKGKCLHGSAYCYDHSSAPVLSHSGAQLNKCEAIDGTKEETEVFVKTMEDLAPNGSSETQKRGVTDNGKAIDQKDVEEGSIYEENYDQENSDDGSEYDEGENLQHLREVFEVDDGEDSIAERGSVASLEVLNGHEQSTVNDKPSDSNEWSWDDALEERWDCCETLLDRLRMLLSKVVHMLRTSLTVAKVEFKNSKIRAKAKAYENKSVIGGTMVGCISRLESIRKTRPFAILVEEASEVLEPLLFACLTPSTIKLQLIGDHRQLQPSLMGHFGFEVMNKAHISMFQRLIEAPLNHELPSTVLSMQRRMRKNISDLTRDFYSNVTVIEDNESCQRQVIGMKSSMTTSKSLIRKSSSGGRETPGVGPHVFLWTHEGKQERAKVGVSRENPTEAKMACYLAAFMVECGVPRSSIAILTPYKGQLMTMRDLLFKDQRLKKLRLLSKNNQDTDVCRLSTVDRFQGDEEDIIICSLVVDENSRTGFVKLENRMIVLLSRARLGFYMVGNLSYFESTGTPKHWTKTFEKLQTSEESDSDETLVAPADYYSGIRAGPQIPLCCPIHRHSTAMVASADLLRLGFCREICHEQLKCGHPCSIQCHWPQQTHNESCAVEMESPCSRHPGKLLCHEAFSKAYRIPSCVNHVDVLNYYRCQEIVAFTLSCSHVARLPCFEERQVSAGSKPQPICEEKSPTPYVFPSCGHDLQVKCNELALYKANPSLVKCKRSEVFEPPCAHHKTMPCFKKMRIVEGDENHVCDERIRVKLPRCGHDRTMPCPEAQKLTQWSGTPCDQVGVVLEGGQYGPEDYPCQRQVSLHRNCGHHIKLPCSQAFLQSKAPPPCREKLLTRHPCCGHSMRLACSIAKKIQESQTDSPEPKQMYSEGHKFPKSPVNGVPLCVEKVQVRRKCGHVEEIMCSDIGKPQTGCVEVIEVQSPLCGHALNVACHMVKELTTVQCWSSSVWSEIKASQRIPKDAAQIHSVGSFSREVKDLFRCCKKKLIWTQPCGHDMSVNCAKLPSVLNQSSKTSSCDEICNTALACGHYVSLKCFEVAQYREGILVPTCKGFKRQNCWNFDFCRNTLSVPCAFEGHACCSKKMKWLCKEGSHEFDIFCKEGIPTDCPGCAVERLGLVLGPFEKEVETLRNALDFVKESDVEWMGNTQAPYLEKENEMLKQMKDAIEIETPWKSATPRLTRVPIFRVLKKGNKGITTFDPKKFIKGMKSMHGIIAKLFQRKALQSIVPKGPHDAKVTLLVGYASLANAKIRQGKLPSSNNDKKELMRSLLGSHDSMIFQDENDVESVVVWDPFPMVAVCRLSLCPDDLHTLSTQVTDIDFQALESSPISIQPAPKGVQLFQAESPEDREDTASASSSEEDEMDFSERLNGTVLEDRHIDANWTRGFDSPNVPHTVEKNLMKKMQFLNRDAKPFEAIKYLRNLIKESMPQVPVLRLLIAAETVDHSLEEAKVHFSEYLEMMEAQALHPWALLVASRLEDKPITKLISLFVELFPREEKVLLDSERDLLSPDDALDENVPSKHEKLKNEWESLESSNPGITKSKAMSELLELVGLSKVKAEALQIWKSALVLLRMDEDFRKENQFLTNYCFLGNPGTGKTSVARLFASILCDSKVRKRDVVIETTAQKLKDGGTKELEKLVQSAMGGVLFIDEAYDLDPVGDISGKPIVNELLVLCENHRDDISVILAGYEDDFNKKFFAYNPGLRSRFKEVLFEDFEEDELSTIWTSMRTRKKWQEEVGVCSVVSKRLAKAAGTKGFANAREVRQRLDSATKVALSRLQDRGGDLSPDSMVLEVKDVIGEDPRLCSEKLKKVVEEVKKMIGWKRVMQKVSELVELCGVNYRLELLGKPPLDIFLNRMFLGNPGTGKTTCAKLYGRLLKELGFLSNGEVVSKTASDFVGSHIGESQKKTNQILEGAKGKVLIIDEAYTLDDDFYGKQVLDTLVEKVQGNPSDDIAVLLLGYEEQMIKMIDNQNPGLARRFPKDHAFYFDDYTDDELLKILDFNLKKSQVNASLDFREKAMEILQTQKLQSNFGNAGAVQLLLKGAMAKGAERSSGSEGSIKLQAYDLEDPGELRSEKSSNPLEALDKLYRMDKVKQTLLHMQKNWEVQKREGEESPAIGHFVFLGSPGTGKTTLARAIADILYGLSLVPSNKIVERTALELTAEFIGQTKVKVEDAMKESKGGILFIDEAYNLGDGLYGKEAVDTLVGAMTSESYKDVVIIIAGYPTEIKAMLKKNPGLESRFTTYLQFPDWETNDCESFFKLQAENEGFFVEEGAFESFREGCSRIKQLKGWGNGRDVNRLWAETKAHRSTRVYDQPEIEKTIKYSDVKPAVKDMIQARIGKLSDVPEDGEDPLSLLDSLFRMDEIKKKIERMRKTLAVAKRDGGKTPKIGHFVFTGSPGTGKTTVARAIARILFGLQLKPSDKLVEVSALDLQAEYLGQTSSKVHDILSEGKGGIVFIDEAYNLGQGQFGKEAMDTIVAAMTSPEYQDVQIVLAGYPDDMEKMFKVNSGLKSRFEHFFHFPDWNEEDCALFFQLCAKNEGFESMGNQILNTVQSGCKQMIPCAGWANGRDVRRLWDLSKSYRAERMYDLPPKDAQNEKTSLSLSLTDVEQAMEELLGSRESSPPKHSNETTMESFGPTLSNIFGGPPPPPGRPQEGPTKTREIKRQDQESKGDTQHDISNKEAHSDSIVASIDHKEEDGIHSESEAELDQVVDRDEGVPDYVWEELQKAKQLEQEEMREKQQLEEEARELKRREEEERLKHLEELRRVEQEREKKKREEARREAEEKEHRRRENAERKRKQLEEQLKRQAEKERCREEMRLRLRQISNCPQGFAWYKQGGGWRCCGGSHFVSNEELQRRFGHDVDL